MWFIIQQNHNYQAREEPFLPCTHATYIVVFRGFNVSVMNLTYDGCYNMSTIDYAQCTHNKGDRKSLGF